MAMTLKTCVIRLWVAAILLGCMGVGDSPFQLDAQTPSSPPYVSPSATQASQPVTRSLLIKARAFEARGRLDIAVQTWQQVLLIDPNNGDALDGLARAAAVPEAETRLKAILAKEPGDLSAIAGMGYVRMQQGNFPGAMSFLEQAQQKNPTDKALAAALDTARFWFIMGEGQSASTANDLTTAEKRFRAALVLRADSPDALEGLGSTLLRAQEPLSALPLFARVVEVDSSSVEGWRGLFIAQYEAGNAALALATDRRIPADIHAQLASDPSFLQALAQAYSTMGRGEEARRVLQSALRLPYPTGQKDIKAGPPADVEIQNAWLLYNGMDDSGLYRQLMGLGGRSDLTEQQRQTLQTIWSNWALRRANQWAAAGNSPRALAILNAAAQSFPDDPVVYRALANGYAQAHQFQNAVQIYKAHTMVSASRADYEGAVGAALALGDNKDAEVWLRYALVKYPSDPQILILGAKFEQARGDISRAIEYYRASLKAMPPPHPEGLPVASTPKGTRGPDLSILLAPGTDDLTSTAGVRGGLNQTNAAAELPHSGAGGSRPEGDRPFAPYVAPPPVPTVSSADLRMSNPSAVTVELGNSTPPPMQPQTEMTDVLPTARYVPNTRPNASDASDPNAAAAQTARTHRLQAESTTPRTGQGHPPPEESGASKAQISPPSTAPSSQPNGISDTGAQQYPQPRTAPGAHKTRRQARPKPAPASTGAAPSAPESAPTVAANQSDSSDLAQPLGAPTFSVAAPPIDAQLAAQNLPPLHGYYAAQAPITGAPRQEVEHTLASLEGSYSGWIGGTGLARYRSGAPGLDRIFEFQAPVEASANIGRSVRLTAIARSVFLNSGVLGSSSFTANYVPYVGTLPANSANPPAQQFANGIGGELQLTTRNLGLSAGYTPYNFLVRNYTGRFSWRSLGGHLSVFADRDSVKDTQLSYAGLRDPGIPSLGPIWGGVISTTGGVRLHLGSFYVSGEGGVLTGRHVLKNTKFGGATGVNFRLKAWPGYGILTLGGALFGTHYANNETGLTYGQGGYFSPTFEIVASVPVTFNGTYKSNFHYVITGALGVQVFEQDRALFYPLDPSLQASLVPCTKPQVPSYNCGEYPLTVTSGFNYASNAQVSYRLADHWYGGGFFSGTNINSYNTVSAGFFFRYVFRAQHPSGGYPTGLFPVEGLRSPQIP